MTANGLSAALLMGATAVLGCGTDCDDAAGKLEFCELPVPSTLGAECDDEGTLACAARCVRDTSCRQLRQSMLGDETDFDRCAAGCRAPGLFDELMDSGEGGAGGAGGTGGADAEQ